MKTNIITLTDSYKFGHHAMYPEGTEVVYSYFEARKGARFDDTVFFGLQALIREHLVGRVVTREGIEKAAVLAKAHFGTDKIFNRAGWEYILNFYDGKLPVRIKAVPEGTPVSVSNVMLTIENTDPKCFWLTNHLETLLTHVWYSSTVATLSRETKKIIKKYLEKTSDNLGGLNFMLHDFGARGVSSAESAAMGGMAHLVNFLGTDTMVAMEAAMEYYDAPVEGLAYSVPATEHSVMTSRGPEDEARVIGDLIKQYPTGILSVVVDSYDYRNCVGNIIGKQFRDAILARDGVFVVRPDSGNPEEVTLTIIENLGKNFGVTINSKGKRVLNSKVRVLWGDGIDIRGVDNILGTLEVNGWSAENMVFGMGGGLLQKCSRDSQNVAFKCSAQKRDGVWHEIYKDPIDKGKSSKRGRLALVRTNDGTGKTGWITIKEAVAEKNPGANKLITVFENGELVKKYTFAEVRKNAELT